MTEWHYSQQGRQLGPVNVEALRQMIAAGQVRGDDLVWNPSMTEWRTVASVPEVASALPKDGGEGSGGSIPPAHVLGYQGVMTEPVTASPQAIEWLRQTRPWARFIGILLYVGAGLMVVGGAIMAAVTGDVGAVGMTCFYMVFGLLYIIPGIFLNRYATRIGSLVQMRRPEDLESALEAQKSFWKFVGIFALVILIIYAVLALVLLAVGVGTLL